MSRIRTPSPVTMQAIQGRMATQRQAAIALSSTSAIAAATDDIQNVADDLAAIDAAAIEATLADYGMRISALETP